MVMSVESWMSDRKRSSLRLICRSALSFLRMVTPAIQITKTRTNAPMIARAFPSAPVNSLGMTPVAMRIWPAPMPIRLQNAAIPHVLDPALEMFSSAMNAKAPHSTGPQPVR